MPVHRVSSAWSRFRRQVRGLLWWLAGVTPDEMERQRRDVQARYSALGLVFLLWLPLMLGIWFGVGHHYFGWTGAMGAALLPLLMLALDRLMVSAPHSPGGELSGYAIEELRAQTAHTVVRYLIAISFSATSTFTFLMVRAQPQIEQVHQLHYAQANAALRTEIEAARKQEHAALLAVLDKRAADLGSRQGELSEDITLVRERNRTSESQAQRSRQQAVEEVGGLNGRQPGAGRRHDAYERLAMEAAAAAAQASNTEAVLRPQLASVQEALRTLNGERLVAVRTHLTAMAGVSADMAQDPRHVPKLSGLFADATVFLSFYADPAQAMGLIVMTILGALCLASCELAPLLGARFRGDTPYDVDRLARSRADAARFVAEAEIDLARAYRESPLVTRPLAGAPTNRPQEHQP